MKVNIQSWRGNPQNWVDSKGNICKELPSGWNAPSMKDNEMKQISRKFFKEIKFVNVGGKKNPCMTPRTPSTTYQLPERKKCIPLLDEFYEKFKRRMQQYEFGEIWYVLDPYHQWFTLKPAEMEEEGEWVVIPYPDGEYRAFISKNLKNGLFIHPWARTICLFGGHMQFKNDELPGLLKKSSVI